MSNLTNNGSASGDTCINFGILLLKSKTVKEQLNMSFIMHTKFVKTMSVINYKFVK